MEDKKKFELNDEALDNVTGGMSDDGWYEGFGYPPEYHCPKCGKDVWRIARGRKVWIDGDCYYTDEFQCGFCDYLYSTDGRYPIGYC